MPRRYAHVVGEQFGSGVFRGQPYQWGMGYPPYRNFQEGEGIGDIFRNVMRFLLPIVAPIAAETATKFVGSTAQALKEGHSIGAAAKRSIAPALGVAMEGATSKILEGVRSATQGGTGRKRRRRRSKVGGGVSRPKRRRRSGKAKVQIGGRRKRKRHQVGGRRKRKSHQSGGKRKGVYKRRRRERKLIPHKFFKSNF